MPTLLVIRWRQRAPELGQGWDLWSVARSVAPWSGIGCNASCAISCGRDWRRCPLERSWWCARSRRQRARAARYWVLTSTGRCGGSSPPAPRVWQARAAGDDVSGAGDSPDPLERSGRSDRPRGGNTGARIAVLPPVDLPGLAADLPVLPELQRVCDRGTDRSRHGAWVVVDSETAPSLRALAPWRGGPGSPCKITPLPR